MKVLFLDHQGVMYLKEWPKTPNLVDFDKECVKVLNEIILKTDCEIVISSDWKLWVSLDEMQKFYLNQGIIKSPISYTTHFKYELNIQTQRSNEILDWLEHNVIDEWVVVDDVDMSSYINNFIHIKDIKLGIKSNGIKNRIISILN